MSFSQKINNYLGIISIIIDEPNKLIEIKPNFNYTFQQFYFIGEPSEEIIYLTNLNLGNTDANGQSCLIPNEYIINHLPIKKQIYIDQPFYVTSAQPGAYSLVILRS